MRPFEIGFKRLVEVIETYPEVRHLVHSDLLNNNVLVEGDRVSAVLDWGSAKYGDPLYDAAWLSFWWPWYSAWRNIDIDPSWKSTTPRTIWSASRSDCTAIDCTLASRAWPIKPSPRTGTSSLRQPS